MFKVVIERERELQVVGYYKTQAEATRVAQRTTIYSKHTYRVSVVEFSEDELPTRKKSDSNIGLWL